MQESIGRRIAQRRLAKGMTQERLAREMGVSAQAISKWENDQNCPDVTLLTPLAKLLGTTVDELLTGATAAPTGAPVEVPTESEPAATSKPSPSPARAPKNAQVHVQVTGGREGDNVDVAIPVSFIRFAAKMALAQPKFANNAALEGFDVEAILCAVEQGEVGTIIDLTNHDSGERVRIWVA